MNTYRRRCYVSALAGFRQCFFPCECCLSVACCFQLQAAMVCIKICCCHCCRMLLTLCERMAYKSTAPEQALWVSLLPSYHMSSWESLLTTCCLICKTLHLRAKGLHTTLLILQELYANWQFVHWKWVHGSMFCAHWNFTAKPSLFLTSVMVCD